MEKNFTRDDCSQGKSNSDEGIPQRSECCHDGEPPYMVNLGYLRQKDFEDSHTYHVWSMRELARGIMTAFVVAI